MFAPAPTRKPQTRGTPLSRSRTPRPLVLALAAALGATLAAAAPATAEPEVDPAVDPADPAAVAASRVAPTPAPEPATLTNPVSSPFADSFADPAVLRGKDGWWYAYATSDPLVSGGEFGLMHMARTRDFAEWEYLGTVFDDATKPAWAAEGSFFWAPDVRFVNGEYRLYYTVTDSAAKPGNDPGIGMATAPTPAGPWTDIGRPVVESAELPLDLLRDDVTPFEIDETGGAANALDQALAAQEDGPGTRADDGEPAPPSYAGLIDPSLFVDDDGTVYMYVGGFAGGPQVVELDQTGTETVGELQQVAVSDRYEGSYVLRHGDLYYLMLSAAGCCSAVASGYSVFVGRSESPLGPFVDADGFPLADSRAGGTQVLASNGNRWVGVGHHAVMTDTTGQDWMVYHGIDRDDGWLDEPGGINKRPMLVDRMDWIDGWPVVNAGAGPSEDPIPGPVLGSAMGITSDDPASGRAFRALVGRFSSVADDDGDAGRVGELRPARRAPAVATARELLRGESRFETDVRLEPGAELCVRVDGWRRGAEVCVDDADRALTSSARGRDDRLRAVAPLPDRLDLEQWHTLVVTLDGEGVRAELHESRLGDPVAVASTAAPRGCCPWWVVAGRSTSTTSAPPRSPPVPLRWCPTRWSATWSPSRPSTATWRTCWPTAGS
jgi:beta-xylosidase